MMHKIYEMFAGETHDPPWRVAAYWLTILAFFTLPMVYWIVDLLTVRTWSIEEYSYVWRFHAMLGGMMVAILGLNSLDRYFRQKNGDSTSEKK